MISSLIKHAARHAGDTEIVSKRVEGDLHRYNWLAAELRSRKLAQALARLDCAARDVVMPVVPVVPMFHGNAWGLPYACAIVGCKLVMPGPHMDGNSLYELFEGEGVTFSAGVPTIWLGLLSCAKANGLKFSGFNRTVIGGSACLPALMATLIDEFGVDVIPAWGMTEMSPLGTAAKLNAVQAQLSKEEQRSLLVKQGRAIYGVDMAIINDEGQVSVCHDARIVNV